MVRISPAGETTVFTFPIQIVGDIIRGLDGNIWFWTLAGSAWDLVQLTPSGTLSIAVTGVTRPGGLLMPVSGTAQDLAGTFYIGGGGGMPIYSLPPGSTTLTFHSWGYTPNVLLHDPITGALYVRNPVVVAAVPNVPGLPVTNVMFGATVAPLPAGSFRIEDGAIGWSGAVVIMVTYPDNSAPYAELVVIGENRVYGTIGRIWATDPQSWNHAYRIARGPAGDL
jgi:hypothetical protein